MCPGREVNYRVHWSCCAREKLHSVTQLAGPRSLRHAQALQDLWRVQRGLKDFVAASKAIKEALAIMEELGLNATDEQYGSMLLALGGLDQDQGRYKEALAICDRAKAVLVQYKEGNECGCSMAICLERLHQGNEAVACSRKLLRFPATCTAPAILITRLRCENTVDLAQRLAAARQHVEQPTCDTIDVTACATSAARSRRRWTGALDAAVYGIATRSSTGPRTSRCQCLSALRHGVDQDQALLTLSQGQVLWRRVQQGPLERTQKGLQFTPSGK